MTFKHFMNPIMPYIKMLRPANALMAGAAVVLGAWLARSADLRSIFLLVIAAISAVGYGNVINDIKDIDTDRISHPQRPLPKKELTPSSASILAFFLFSFSLVNAFLVSPVHGIGTLGPLLLLSVYAFYFKGTPLAGNILVSLLVAYALVFGGLKAPLVNRLFVPALLAFLLNLAREIIKDFQDEAGDRLAGLTTTALVPKSAVQAILSVISIAFAVFLFVPYLAKHFGIVYAVTCMVLVLPVHIWWSLLALRSRSTSFLSKISGLIKLEMIAGLLALAADRLLDTV